MCWCHDSRHKKSKAIDDLKMFEKFSAEEVFTGSDETEEDLEKEDDDTLKMSV